MVELLTCKLYVFYIYIKKNLDLDQSTAWMTDIFHSCIMSLVSGADGSGPEQS